MEWVVEPQAVDHAAAEVVHWLGQLGGFCD